MHFSQLWYVYMGGGGGVFIWAHIIQIRASTFYSYHFLLFFPFCVCAAQRTYDENKTVKVSRHKPYIEKKALFKIGVKLFPQRQDKITFIFIFCPSTRAHTAHMVNIPKNPLYHISKLKFQLTAMCKKKKLTRCVHSQTISLYMRRYSTPSYHIHIYI